ncbi:uncharacterized protein C2orf66 homolog [Hemicordylus capensis]|uniref:uncharacterized protein C2orf66 homolog n=1 Tax=Hemicordylus capensis TaxID=884348 RepID=UPI00230367D1|nr:uncharacterized protein C2orf66 homolog [Hemicordylus capensis]
MWKLVLLVECTMLMLRGLGQGAPLRPEETWKPLDNPRNRDLFFRTLKAYFSGRGLDFRKFSDTFTVSNDKPRPITLYSDLVASAFAAYEENKNSKAEKYRKR